MLSKRAPGIRSSPPDTVICSAGTRDASPRRCAASRRSPSTAPRASTRCAPSTRPRGYLRVEVVSLADVLAPAAQNLACPLTRKSVYYHDPCYHARYNGVVEQPRRALSQLAELREFSWNKTDTECCGGGGLLPKTMPMAADQMAKRRLAEVQQTGGGMVVTSCATCTFMLQRNAPPSVDVVNLATAMARLSETPFTAPTSIPDADEG